MYYSSSTAIPQITDALKGELEIFEMLKIY